MSKVKTSGQLLPFSACGAGGRIKPGVERGSAEPQEYRVDTHQAREAARQLFVIRHYQWLSPSSRAYAINSDRTWGCGCAPPRALLCRPLSRAKIYKGVSSYT